jgi:hypothetical protein
MAPQSTHEAVVSELVEAVGHERVAAAGEEVVALVLEAPPPDRSTSSHKIVALASECS